ncbi:unnamed protein product [Paramecium pentaurelia]|uniref:Transmembrane protein n=1 Tax=Paramecium pentaurelia TaxID=43138 RepID=A0A8S1V1R8_9CILI|nr:unnamed protein product [Paramecium pentaurelia]
MQLDYQRVQRITDIYNSTFQRKLYYEFQFAFIAITTLLTFGITKITLLGSIAILRKLLKKLCKTEFFSSNQMIFNMVYGIYCLDAVYLFLTNFRIVSLPSQVIMCYQLVMYIYVGTKNQKERHFTLENSLKNIMFREIELAYIYALTYLEQSTSINQIMLILCFLIQLFIFQMTNLINQRGELLQQRAKGLSVWIKLPSKPPGDFVNWNYTQEKYPPNVTVQYNNNYYRLQNLYNTSPPEDIKAIFIQLLFYNIQRTKQRLSIILFIVCVFAVLIDIDALMFNLEIQYTIIPDSRK